MNEQPPPGYGPWAASAKTATDSEEPIHAGALGAYLPHVMGPSAKGKGPRGPEVRGEGRDKRPAKRAAKDDASPVKLPPLRSPKVMPSPSPSPAKRMPAQPLARREGGPTLVYANARVRALAGALDGAMLLLALAPGIGLLLADLLLPGVVVLMLGMLGLASLQSALTVAHGQSLAKRWLGLRLIDDEGERVGYVRGVVLRGGLMTVAYVVSAGALFIVELVLLVRTGRCLADRLARTTVIEARTFGDPYLD